MKILVRHEFHIPREVSRSDIDYLAGFLHDALDDLGVEMPSVDVDFGTSTLGVEVVTAETDTMTAATNTFRQIRMAFELAGQEVRSDGARVWAHPDMVDSPAKVTQEPVPA